MIVNRAWLIIAISDGRRCHSGRIESARYLVIAVVDIHHIVLTLGRRSFPSAGACRHPSRLYNTSQVRGPLVFRLRCRGAPQCTASGAEQLTTDVGTRTENLKAIVNDDNYEKLYFNVTVVTRTKENSMKKVPRGAQTLRAGCNKAEPKIFAPPQTPFPEARDGQNLIS